ncbi:MAG: PAS domain S-box protein [Gemmatimonadota bacterium]
MNSAYAASEEGTRTRVLIVEDMPFDSELMLRELVRGGLECVTRRVETEPEFRDALAEFRPDIVLADYNLPRFSGMRAFRIVNELGLDTPVILISGTVTEEFALQCLQAGVADYLLKDHLLRLGPAVKAVLESTRTRRARKKVEDERASLEMRFSAFADSTADAMIVSDADGRIRFWNRAATSIFGFTADEVLGEPVLMIVPETLHARYEEGMKAAARGGPLVLLAPICLTGLHKSGVEVPIELTPGSWNEGGATFFSAVVRDITERVEAENRLRASTEYYRAILEHLPVVAYEASLDQPASMTWLSPQIEELLGSPADRLEGAEAFFERIHPDDRDWVAAASWVGRDSGSMDIEFRISHEDGRFLWIRDRAVVGPSVASDGSRVIRGVLQDVTAARESERKRALLSKVVEQSSSSVIVTDIDGNIEYANPAFETITGYSREEVIGKNPRLLKSRGHPPAFYEEMWAELLAGRSWTREFVNRRKDGTEYHQRSTVFPIQDAEGRTQNFAGIGQDVSNERALEQQLRQAQKMEAVGQLTGGIAHDFNNVLAAILTNAQLLAMELPPEAAHMGSEVRDIESAARRGADLIKRLMVFSRDEHLELEVVDPSEILKETVALLRRLLPANIELTLEEAHSGALINVDRSGIQHILLNLATNARDAMPDGGTMVISTSVTGAETKGTESDGEPRVEIAVRDTGVGMDEETLERAFDPFFTTKDRGKGTGLGLAMVHGLMRRHSGTTRVSSEPGLGSTFTIRLPLAGPDEQLPRKSADLLSEPGAHSGTTVLLVEDEDPVRRAGQRVLDHFGYRVLVAENGRQALELLEAHRAEISLVITDVIMPELGGAELYQAISHWEPRPAFLFTSGYNPHTVGGPISDGDVPFIRKPWDATGLAKAVQMALKESQNSETVVAP